MVLEFVIPLSFSILKISQTFYFGIISVKADFKFLFSLPLQYRASLAILPCPNFLAARYRRHYKLDLVQDKLGFIIKFLTLE